MELRHIRYFVAVAEELHFGRAAERLHMTQPPLSVAVRTLERELGVELLHRSTRQVTLTSAGQEFLARVRPALEELDATAQQMSEVAAGHRGHIRVGFVSSASYRHVPVLARTVKERLPGLQLDLLPCTTVEQIDLLLADDIDLGIVRDAPRLPETTTETIASEGFNVAFAAEHHFTELERVPVRELDNEPMIAFPYKLMPGYLDRLYRLFADADVSPVTVQQVIHQETSFGLAAAGVGVVVVPESTDVMLPRGVEVRQLDTATTTDVQAIYRTANAARVQPLVSALLES